MLPVIPVSIGSGRKTLKTLALCDFAASLSFVDKTLVKALKLTKQLVELNVAGIHGTLNISSERIKVDMGSQGRKVYEIFHAYCYPDVNAGNRTYNLKKLKEENPLLSALKETTINFGDVKATLCNDCYHLHEQQNLENIRTQSLGSANDVDMDGQWTGPLPQQETAKLLSGSWKPSCSRSRPLAD